MGRLPIVRNTGFSTLVVYICAMCGSYYHQPLGYGWTQIVMIGTSVVLVNVVPNYWAVMGWLGAGCLQERLMKQGRTVPIYTLKQAVGADHSKCFIMTVSHWDS